MPIAAVLAHHDIAHELGHLAPWLEDGGYVVERIYRGEPFVMPPADLLIVMGSPTSVATGHLLSPAVEEIEVVRDWVATGRPYLGMCFGAQVLAQALGGAVTRLDCTFRGYIDCSRDNAELPKDSQSLAGEVGLTGPWVVWHDDAITAPSGSEVLARLPHADIVFRSGNAWGLQPHIEVTSQSLERMAVALGADDTAYAPLVAALAADEVGPLPARARVAQFLDAAFGTIR